MNSQNSNCMHMHLARPQDVWQACLSVLAQLKVQGSCLVKAGSEDLKVACPESGHR